MTGARGWGPRERRRRLAGNVVGLLASIAMSIPMTAAAATIRVNTTADELRSGDARCTLREAINNVNALADLTGGDCQAGNGVGDEITFTFAMPAKIRLRFGQLYVERDVRISNPAAGSLHLDGMRKARVVEIAAGTTRMTNVIIERGHALVRGGGILVKNGATLDLVDCEVTRNTANVDPNADSEGVWGGGISNEGTLTLTDCAVERNKIVGGDESAFGAGIFNGDGVATLINCTIAGNRFKSGEYGESWGGAIHNDLGTVTLTDCTLRRNQSKGGASGVAYGGAISNLYGEVTVSGCTLSANRATCNPGFEGSGFALGGAIYIETGTVVATNSTLKGNVAFAFNSFVIGGAIDNDGGELVMEGCTVSHNAALAKGDNEIYGGAIYNGGLIALKNCTLVANRAAGLPIADGGAIVNDGDGTVTNCTLSENVAQNSPDYPSTGGIAGVADLIVTNTIFASNKGFFGDCDDYAISGGHNLNSDDTCFPAGGTDLINAEPNLGPLGSHGGSTETMPLCRGARMPYPCRGVSPAIDAGDDAVTSAPYELVTDQRGLPRNVGAHVDIGAYEVQ